jgi:hypothetical protein
VQKQPLSTRTVLAVVVATLCIQRSTRLHPASRRCWPRYSTPLLALKISIAESRLVFSRCQVASSNPLRMITMLLFLGICQLREAWPLRLIRTIPVGSLSHLPREVTHTQAAVIRVQRDVGKSSRVARTFLSEAIGKIRLWRCVVSPLLVDRTLTIQLMPHCSRRRSPSTEARRSRKLLKQNYLR